MQCREAALDDAAGGGTNGVGDLGWRCVALDEPDLELSGTVARRHEGEDAGHMIGRAPIGLSVVDSVEAAVQAGTTHVHVDSTHPSVVKANVLAALARGVPASVGTSVLSAADYSEIAKVAKARSLGVVATGNFSITAALLQHFTRIAVRHVLDFEIIDYTKHTEPNLPSRTAHDLAERLGAIAPVNPGVPLDQLIGPKEARGADRRVRDGSRLTADPAAIGDDRLQRPAQGYAASESWTLGASEQRMAWLRKGPETGDPYACDALAESGFW